MTCWFTLKSQGRRSKFGAVGGKVLLKWSVRPRMGLSSLINSALVWNFVSYQRPPSSLWQILDILIHKI